MIPAVLSSRLERGELAQFDIQFAMFMAKLAKTNTVQLINLFANLARAEASQHSCFEINDPALIALVAELDVVTDLTSTDTLETPLILVENKLYLQRYYYYEAVIAEALIARNQPKTLTDKQQADMPALLEQLFPTQSAVALDWQKVAAYQCLSRRLTVITGGPGTGKTSTIVKILAALKQQSPKLHIRLSAPTGKAAMRLSNSIYNATSALPEDLQANIVSDVTTVHRLLGMRADGYSFKYHEKNLLNIDLLILDEASMLDLILFYRLVSALPKHCNLILVGDPEQLPSVESGAVFRDVCSLGSLYSTEFETALNEQVDIQLPSTAEANQSPHQLQDVICRLQKSYRFDDAIGIGALSKQIRQGQDIPLQLFEADASGQLALAQQYDSNLVTDFLLAQYKNYIDGVEQHQDAETLLTLFDQFRAFAPLKRGDLGVEKLNQLLEKAIAPRQAGFYHGKPIMVNRNDYKQQLFNGDVGICVEMDNGELLVAFPPLSRLGTEANIRYFLPSRLPTWEACYVMTVHKSQGSEFNAIALILPQDTEQSALVSNELIYTAVTRAKQQVTLFSDLTTLNQAITRRLDRVTGLKEKLA